MTLKETGGFLPSHLQGPSSGFWAQGQAESGSAGGWRWAPGLSPSRPALSYRTRSTSTRGTWRPAAAPAGTCPASSPSQMAPPPCSWYAALNCATGKVSQAGTPRTSSQDWVHMGSWAVPSSGQHLSSELCPVGSLGPSSPSPHHPPLSPQPGASWIADCTRHHCGSTPLGAVLVHSPISCPPLNETECAKVSASHLSLQHGWRPGVLAALVVVAGRGRGVFWCGDVWKESFPGIWTCPATLTPPELHISPCIFALTPSYNIRTHHTRVSRCTQTYTHSQHTHIHTNMGSQPLTGTTQLHRAVNTSSGQCTCHTPITLAHVHHTDVLFSPAVG